MPKSVIRMAVLLGAVAGLIGALVLFCGIRRPLSYILEYGRLASDAILIFLVALSSAWGASRLSVPPPPTRVARILPRTMLVFWASFLLGQAGLEAATQGPWALVPDFNYVCTLLIAVGSGVAMIPATVLLRGAAPLDAEWFGGLIGLFCSSSAVAGVQFVCLFDSPAHLVFWHLAPVTIFILLGSWIGSRVLPSATPSTPSRVSPVR